MAWSISFWGVFVAMVLQTCGKFIEPIDRELRFAYWDGKGFFAMIKDGERITAWTFQPKPYDGRTNNE